MDVDATSIQGTWWRHIPAGADVHHQPAHPADGRWQRGSVIEALYLANSEDTTWAEWYRYLAETAIPPKQALPRDLWRWEITLTHVANLTTDERRHRVGLPKLQPTRLQWPAFQAVGEQLSQEAWPALVTASAARPKGRVLCVFRTSRNVPGTQPLTPPKTLTDPPTVPAGLRT